VGPDPVVLDSDGQALQTGMGGAKVSFKVFHMEGNFYLLIASGGRRRDLYTLLVKVEHILRIGDM
jgi:hypothetical protein